MALVGEFKKDDPLRRCSTCGKDIDDYPYELWLFHTCRACAAETRTREWRQDFYGGSQRKWCYEPRWHLANRPR